MDEETRFLYNYVMNNNPHIHPDDIDCFEALNIHDLQITFKNGITEVYDTFANTCRRVKDIDKPRTDKQIRNDFKRYLQIMMNRKWVDQTELAKRVDTTQPMISRYLSGSDVPGYLMLGKLAKALGCDVDDFYE